MSVLPFHPENGHNLPTRYTEQEIRHYELPPVRYLVEGLLPVGLTINAAPPKIGKTFFGQQIEHYLSARQPFLAFPPRDDSVRCLVVDLEGNAHITKKRSWLLANRGDFSRIEYRHDIPGGYAAERIMWLDTTLCDAREDGQPYGYVRIDTLRLFLGPTPGTRNAYDVDNNNSKLLNQLALAHGIAILANTHLTKGGSQDEDWVERVTGSAGGPGGATGIWLLERTRGSKEGVLRTTSRDAEEGEFALRFDAGRWSLADDITPDQAKRVGTPRLIVDYITAHGPSTRAQLDQLADANTVGKSLGRMKEDGTLDYCGITKRWSLIAAGPRHATFKATEPAPAIDDAPPPDPEPEPAESDVTALTRLKTAIGTVTTRPCAPIPLIRKEDRSEMPWSLVAEDGTTFSGGRHRWNHPDLRDWADDLRVVVLDRRASYPSAMSSVPVAPNRLLHTYTSPMKGRAGLYLITPAPYEGSASLGHPLGIHGERAAAAGDPVWVTAPGIRLMDKLDIGYALHDSWTGKPVCNLFEDWYKWVRDTRANWSGDDDELAMFKRQTSTAIRLIWPRTRESGLWRPDWHNAIHAEANARHWVKAHKAIAQGATLVSMANTDETVWLVPPNASDEWLPPGYTEGPAFGHVSVKARVSLGEWKATKRGGAR